MASSASSSDGGEYKQSTGKHWTINLRAFSKTRTRLETILRKNDLSIDLLDSYCKTSADLLQVNPLVVGKDDGANPMMRLMFNHEPNDGDANLVSSNLTKFYKLSELGSALNTHMDGDG